MRYPRELLTPEENAAWGEIVDAVFFASLGKEEGKPTEVGIVYHEQGIAKLRLVQDAVSVGGGYMKRAAWEITTFEYLDGVTEFSVETLRKVAPAAAQSSAVVVVGRRTDGKLAIQGIARRLERPYYKPDGEDELFFLRTPKPGCLTLTFQGRTRYYEDGEWSNRTRLRQLLDDPKSIIRAAIERMCKSLIDRLPTAFGSPQDAVIQTVQALVLEMTALRSGGLIAMTESPPSNVGKFRLPLDERTMLSDRILSQANDSVASMRSRLEEPANDDELTDAAVVEVDHEISTKSLESAIAAVARLTTIDNALLLGGNLAVVCAGYEVDPTDVSQYVFEAASIEGGAGNRYPLRKHGSRHRAAAAFAMQTPGNLAFIVSQDGPVRCLYRPIDQEYVLLWQVRP